MRDPLSRVQIKYKLPAAFVGVCLLAFGVGGYLISVSAGEALEGEIRQRLRAESALIAQAMEARLVLLRRRAEDFASDGYIRTQLERMRTHDAPGARERLRRHLRMNKLPLVEALSDIVVLPENSAHCASFSAAADDTQWTTIVDESDARVLRRGSLAAMPDRSIVTLPVPVYELHGRRCIGTLVFVIGLGDLLHPTVPLSTHADDSIGSAHRVSLLDRQGGRHVLRQPAHTRASTSLDVAGRPFVREWPHETLLHLREVQPYGWHVEVAVDAATAMMPVSGLQSRFLGAGLLMAVVAMVLLFFPIRFLVRPLSTMRDAARALAGGDLGRRVDVQSEDEIGQLAQSFNIMAEATQERTEALERSARMLEQRGHELAIEKDLLSTVMHSMDDAVMYYDTSGRLLLHNLAAAGLVDIWNNGRLLPAPYRCCADGKHADDCRRCLMDHDLPARECLVDIHGRVHEIHLTRIVAHGCPEGTLLVARDITDRLRFDERQAHQDRLAVLGEVSAVMAHELNNPLAAITLYGQMMRKEISHDAEHHEHIDVILRNADLCKRTLRDLLSYARERVGEDGVCDVAELLADVLRFLRPLYEKANIAFSIEHDLRDSSVRCDSGYVRQVFVNVLMNAVQAMRDQGGRCDIHLRDDDEHRALLVSVADSGPGIPPALHEAIFEPFVTSKPAGEGTGLGLTISRRIMLALGGSLLLRESRPGRTVFDIVIPREAAESDGALSDMLRAPMRESRVEDHVDT